MDKHIATDQRRSDYRDYTVFTFFFVHGPLRFADVGTYIKIFLETFSLSWISELCFFCKLFRITKYWGVLGNAVLGF